MSQNCIIPKLSNIGQATIGSQLTLVDCMIPHSTSENEIFAIQTHGDEYHYLFTCDFLRVTENLKTYFYVKPNIHKYRELFTSANGATLNKLSNYDALIMEKFSV